MAPDFAEIEIMDGKLRSVLGCQNTKMAMPIKTKSAADVANSW
jgi:hypothetical protein